MRIRYYTAMTLLGIMGQASANTHTNLTFTLKNNSHYLLLANKDTPVCSRAPCSSVIGPDKSIAFSIPNNSGIQVAFTDNIPSASGSNDYFGFYVYNDNGSIAEPSIASKDIKTTYDKNTRTLTLTPLNSPATIHYPATAPFRGVNLSGAEAGAGSDYMTNLGQWIPSYEDALPFLKDGANTVRYPIRLAYFTKAQNPEAYLEAVFEEVQDLLKQHVSVILDLHNYMRVFPVSNPTDGSGSDGSIMTSSQIKSAWTLLANKFADLAKAYDGSDKSNPAQLMLEIMNEPNNMDSAAILANTNGAIQIIRAKGINNLILIEGNDWSGLWSWVSGNGNGYTNNAPNATTFTKKALIDPANHWAIAMHQYFDGNASGSGKTCISPQQQAARIDMKGIEKYAQDNGIQIMLDEFGAPTTPTNLETCQQDVSALLTPIDASPYFLGWTAWQAGHAYASVNSLGMTQWKNYYEHAAKQSSLAE